MFSSIVYPRHIERMCVTTHTKYTSTYAHTHTSICTHTHTHTGEGNARGKKYDGAADE